MFCFFLIIISKPVAVYSFIHFPFLSLSLFFLSAYLFPDIPYNDFFEYYGPDFKLHLEPSDIPNLNTREDLEKTKITLLQMLSELEHSPSVQMHQVPPDFYLRDDSDDDKDPDVRISQRDEDKMVAKENEYYDDDRDQDMSSTQDRGVRRGEGFSDMHRAPHIKEASLHYTQDS